MVLLCGGSIAANLLGDGRCARAFPYMLLCLTLTGVENIFKSLFIGLERVQYTACSEVGEQLIRIFAVSFLLYEYGSGDYGRIAMLIFAGMVCSEVFSALFLTRLFRRNMRYIRFTRPDKESLRPVFRHCRAIIGLGADREYARLGRCRFAAAKADGRRSGL